ncbi:MOSC domain-containing protein [Microbacteriaceae bacterium VKM Ac-2854]|nr:MOSC domain-containing protein [Microbacteriaceae bacterium VKM Ac-2854]
MTRASVVAVAAHPNHEFSKQPREEITVVVGRGVEGDAHFGETVQHRSRLLRTPDAPNLRQVHLIAAELFDELAGLGFGVQPGELGENVTTRGIDLLGLPTGARLRMGDAVLEITGLRNPCAQIDGFESGLLKQLVRVGESGEVERRAGVMAVVIGGGVLRAGQAIEVELPQRREPLAPV